MKKLGLLVLPLLLAACNGNGGISTGSVVSMHPNIEGAKIVANLTATANTDGTYSYSVHADTTQPTISFLVDRGSLGVNITSYTVRVMDTSGSVFPNSAGQYQRNQTFHVMGGWACQTTTGTTVTADSTTDQCLENQTKVGYQRIVPISTSLPLIEDIISEGVMTQALSGFQNYMNGGILNCPQLKISVTFSGYDDNGKTINPITANAVPLNVSCNY